MEKEKKLHILSASSKYVIPEVAGRLSGIQKEQQMTGYRISSAVGGLVRYDVWDRIQVFSAARCQLLANNRTVGRIVLAGRG
jgi:uncharacterized Fe-S cluster-containing radical SAM superfamily protein